MALLVGASPYIVRRYSAGATRTIRNALRGERKKPALGGLGAGDYVVSTSRYIHQKKAMEPIQRTDSTTVTSKSNMSLSPVSDMLVVGARTDRKRKDVKKPPEGGLMLDRSVFPFFLDYLGWSGTWSIGAPAAAPVPLPLAVCELMMSVTTPSVTLKMTLLALASAPPTNGPMLGM